MVNVMEPPQTIRPQSPPQAVEPSANETEKLQVMIDVREVDFTYGDNKVLYNISLQMPPRAVTAFIGPSGCGKTTLLRCINRMNDLVDGSRISKGAIHVDGVDINMPGLDVVDLRRRVGMVFQKSNPFPKSIYENIAYGLRVAGVKKRSRIDEAIEKSLRSAALWDEVKDRLDTNAYGLSGGQQQRLCIARALAVEPEVVLMDEPCSALDPIATAKIEELIQALKTQYTIVIVTHNMRRRRCVRQCCNSAAIAGAAVIESESQDEPKRRGRARWQRSGADGCASFCNGQVRANCRFDEGADKRTAGSASGVDQCQSAQSLREMESRSRRVSEAASRSCRKTSRVGPEQTSARVSRHYLFSVWDAVDHGEFLAGLYGIIPLFVGSLLVSLVALVLAVPLGVCAAIYVSEVASSIEKSLMKLYIEFISAIPSVVLGFFGIAGPWRNNPRYLTCLVHEMGAVLPNQRAPECVHRGLLARADGAGPTIFTLAEDALRNVPRGFKEASYALGGNRLQTVVRLLVPAALSGIVSAVLLGLGRVIGETMVVLLCAGNRIAIPDFTQGLGATVFNRCTP